MEISDVKRNGDKMRIPNKALSRIAYLKRENRERQSILKEIKTLKVLELINTLNLRFRKHNLSQENFKK